LNADPPGRGQPCAVAKDGRRELAREVADIANEFGAGLAAVTLRASPRDKSEETRPSRSWYMSELRIVLIGGGFAGIQCGRILRRMLSPEEAEVVLFNKENHTVFPPLLAEVAAAAIRPTDVGAPLRQLLRGIQCRTEEVPRIDLEDRELEYEAENGQHRRMRYDQLVIAAGSVVNLALVPGMADHGLPPTCNASCTAPSRPSP
jgi:Pyridine nucleotide-disulphide oxidoreductase